MSVVLSEFERRIAALPQAEREPRRALLGRVAEAIVEKPLTEIEPLVDELVGLSSGALEDGWSITAARARNLERVLADQARVRRESISGSEVREALGVSRQRLHQLVSQGRLVGLQLLPDGPYYYPFWQFTSGVPVQPISGLSRLIVAAGEAEMEPFTLHFFMVEPNDRLGGRAPYEIAANNIDHVIGLLQSSGLGPL
jgi:biotin operon repressor